METSSRQTIAPAHHTAFLLLGHSLSMVLLSLATPAQVSALDLINYHKIEGYSDIQSVGPEETIKFHVHVPEGRSKYTVEIFRYGLTYIGGNAVGTRVAGPFLATNGMVRNYTENSHATGLTWPESFKLRIPSPVLAGEAPVTSAAIAKTTWKSGIYTAKITDVDSPTKDYFHITFVVKDRAASRKSIALIASTNTWQAYNFWPEPYWGGSSIYSGAVP
jgi:hypothetical protein